MVVHSIKDIISNEKSGIMIKVIILLCISLLFMDSNSPFCPLLHLLIEIVTAIIGYCIMIIAISTKDICENNYIIFLGIAYPFICTMDLFHTITIDKISIILNTSNNISIQFWIAARYLEAFSLLIATKFFYKKVNIKKEIFYYLIISILILVCILKIHIFPNCFLKNLQPTKFKCISELIICIIFSLCIYNLYEYNKKHPFKEYNIIILSIATKIICEIILAFYIGGHCIADSFSHVFKLLSFYLIYYAVVKASLNQPFNTLFKNLQNKAIQLEKVNKELNLKNKELKATTINIENKKEIYSNILRFLPDAVTIMYNKKIVYVNQVTLDLLKIKHKKEIIGTSVFKFLQYDSLEVLKKNLYKKASHFHPSEWKIIRSDGVLIDVEISGMPLNIADKKYYIYILRDLTSRKKLQSFQFKLEKRIEYDKLKNDFFSNISHELRTPINVIYSALQMEDIYLNNNNIYSIKKYNKIIKQNCLRLLRISNNIIDITKIDAGFFNPVLGCYNIVEIIENITLSVVPYTESKNIDLIFDTDIEESFVKCNADIIERIILNLLSNSIKYSKKNAFIKVHIYNTDDNFVAVSVKDNGIGIPTNLQKNIFDRFVQADKSFTRKCEGSGIGLSLVQGFVKLHNGQISLISEEGVGTEFIIKFPTCEGNEQICCTLEQNHGPIIDKVNIEFSDIYL